MNEFVTNPSVLKISITEERIFPSPSFDAVIKLLIYLLRTLSNFNLEKSGRLTLPRKQRFLIFLLLSKPMHFSSSNNLRL